MTLKDKFIDFVYCFMGSGMLTNTYDKDVADWNAGVCVEVADEFAIGFAKWYYVKCMMSNFDRHLTMEVCLEMYKKEQEL
jgi:hypothetical protein